MPRPTAQPAPSRRSGFTLTEMLVVLGIIVLLAAIVTVGVRSALSRVVDSSTRTRLESLDAMLAAYQTSDNATAAAVGRGGNKALPTVVAGSNGKFYSTLDGNDYPAAANYVKATDPLAAPPGQLGDPSAAAARPSILRTQAVMQTLLRVPANQSAYDALPTEAKTSAVTPLLLDGYNKPIIFVPPTGLSGLRFKSDPSTLVTLVSTDGRSFWASAGDDGSFEAADDNIYSTPTKLP